MSLGKSGPTAQIIDRELIKRIKAEFPNYHMHGGMFTDDNSLQVSLPTSGAFVKSTGWTADDSTGAGFVVIDAANGTITIGDKGGGRYQINTSFSFSASRGNVEVHGAIFKGGVRQAKFVFKRTIGSSNVIGDASCLSLTTLLVPGDVLDFRFTSDTNTTTLDIEHGGWGIIWMAGE